MPHPPVLFGITFLYLARTVGVFVVASLIYWIGHNWADVPLGFWTVWSYPNDVSGGMRNVFYLFIWAIVSTTIVGLFLILKRAPRPARPSTILIRGLWLSLHAGFFEEIMFRWLLLLSVPVLLKFLNLISFGLIKWLYGEVLVPIANWTTLGLLEPELTAANWLLGATIISVNGRFRDGHERNGTFATVNAWFIGMLMFYLLFNYGIWAAIVSHIIYDVLVMTTAATIAIWQRPAPRLLEPYYYD